MFTGKSVFTLNTSKDEHSEARATQVTIDWTGLTEEQAKAAMLSGQSPRVRLQAALRKNGIPATTTVRAVDLCSGRAHIPISVDGVVAQAATFTPEQLAQLKAQITALELKVKAAA